MYYGVSYYPEHKNKEELKQDLKLMKESGINTVRMGEFSWCRMEPVKGRYEFNWLTDVVNELGEAGVRTIICTPTACPPAYLVEEHPEILYVDNRGMTRPFGGRRHYCYNNEEYRKASAGITIEIARVYGNHPYVAGFQIDNEPAQEGTGRCHCKVCKEKFRAWLKDKYGTIEELNRRYGAIFWSMEYGSFSQISPPVNTIEPGAQQHILSYYENPSLRLDYERFCSESQIQYQDIQAEILRDNTSYPITTNGTGLATNSINYYRSSRDLTNYGFDYYPGLRDAFVDSYPYAFARGVKSGKSFWVMEFMSGGGHKLNGGGRVQPNPGALKQSVLHAFAHGAQMMLHFQFRTFPFGAEQLNYAIVDMDGIPRRRFYEMQSTAQLLDQLKVLEDAEFCHEAAICFDYDTHWAHRIKPINDEEFRYIDYQRRLYRILMKSGYGIDVISYEENMDKYKAIILPAAFLLSRQMQDKLRKYVNDGGTLIATFLTSVKNEDNVGYTDILPAGLTDVFGSTVEEVEPIYTGNRLHVQLKEKNRESVDNIWSELLRGDSETLASYAEDYKNGWKVVSKNSYGKGKAYYIGTDLKEDVMTDILTDALEEAGIDKSPFVLPENTESVCRRFQDKDYYFLFNFAAKDIKIEIQRPAVNYLTGEAYTAEIPVNRNGFCIVS